MFGSRGFRIVFWECIRGGVILILLSAVMFAMTLIGTGKMSQLRGTPSNELQQARFESAAGLDRSPGEQYFVWLGHLANGNWNVIYGVSSPDEAKFINDIIKERLAFSSVFALATLLLSAATGILFGSLIAARPSRWYAKALIYILDVLSAIPDICIALGLVLIFAVTLRWLPSGGYMSITEEMTGLNRILDIAKHMLIPAITLSLPYGIGLIRTFQTLLKEVLFKDYIRTAKAKGVNELVVIVKHGLRNCIVPYMANVLALVPFFLTGVLIVERIFLLPGLGSLVLDSIYGNPYIVVIIAMIVGVITILSNSASRVIFRLIDPRLESLESNSGKYRENKTAATATVLLAVLAVYSASFFLPASVVSRDTLSGKSAGLLLGLAPIAIILIIIAGISIRTRNGVRGSQRSSGLPAIRLGSVDRHNRQHFTRDVTRIIRKRLPIIISLMVFAILVIMSYIYSVDNLNILEYHKDILAKASPPALQHPMGVNTNGQDILTLFLVTMKDTLMVGLAASAVVCLIGGLLGIFSAYLGGAVERLIGILLDLLSSIPMIFLIIGSFYLVASNSISIAGILALTALPEIANVVKVTALELRTEEFVMASVAMGGRNFHIIHRHIWPNLIGLLLVQGVSLYSRFTLMMASLGYIGLLSFPSWGFLVQMGQKEVFSSWWSPVGPALGLVGVVLLVNGIGRQLSRIIGEKVRIDG